MGVDRLTDAVIETSAIRRRIGSDGGDGVPMLVPIFTKCRQNLGEMEFWYDQWLRALGSAVIVGPERFRWAGAVVCGRGDAAAAANGVPAN